MTTEVPLSPETGDDVIPKRSFVSRFCSLTFSTCAESLKLALKIVVILYFLFCILLLALRYVALPNVIHYKSQVEQMASEAVGRTINIGMLHASWQGLNPQLILNDVVIRDRNGQQALALPEVSATLSWWTLFFADLRFERIDIYRPSLDVQHDADGHWFIGGFFIDPAQEGNGTGLDWVLAQRQIVIHQGGIRWNDHWRHADEVVLPDVSFVLKNQWRRHQFALKATPPASLAQVLDIRGDFQHRVFSKKVSDVSSWTGDLYADLRQADLPALKQYIDYPAELQKGYGSVRTWVRIDAGRIADLTADVHLADVRGQFRRDLPELDMAFVSGRLIASEKSPLGKKYLPAFFGPAGHSLELSNFSMQARDGNRLPATTIRETFIPGEKGQPEKVEIYARTLDLQTLANFAEHLPLPEDQRQMLTDFAPQGQLRDFTATWQGTYPEIISYKLKGQFINLSMKQQAAQLGRAKTATMPAKAAVPAIPGFENLSGSIDASDKGGSFTLDSKDLSLRLSSYFVDPLMPFSHLQMQADWTFEADDKLSFQVRKMEAQQDGMKASVTGKHVISMRQSVETHPGEVDLSARISGFDLRQLDRFIPAMAEPDLRHWLTKAIVGGRADDVSVRIKGDLAHFPFSLSDGKAAQKGEFLVKGNLTGGTLDFTAGALTDDGKAPLWPVINDIKGSFVFDRARMEIHGDSAKTLDADLHKVKAIIPDLLSTRSVLQIDGNASGTLQTMLMYVNASPVDNWLGHFLQETKASNNANLGLKLQLPLRHLLDSKVQGVLQFTNNDVILQTGLPQVSNLTGKLEFNERGVNLGTLKGNLLGGNVSISGGSQKDNSIRIRLDGVATAEGVRKALPSNSIEKVLDRISGSTRYNASVYVKKRQPEIMVESSLIGLNLNFPSPLRKASAEALPLRFELVPQVSGDANIWRDEMRIDVGSSVHARYFRQKINDKNGAWQVLHGGVGVNVPAPDADAGLAMNLDVKTLNIDDWRQLAASVPSGSYANVINTTNAGNASVLFDASSYMAPASLSIRANELQLMGKQFQNVVLGMSQQKGNWQANVDAAQASGHLSWSTGSGQTAGNISARLSHLTIPSSAASEVSDLLEGKNATTVIPGIDLIADNFDLLNKKLGRVELLASNQLTPVGREWQISKILLKNADAELRGSGKWSSRLGQGTTQLDYVLDVGNAGKLLERLGFPDILRGGRGKLEGDVKWNGLPFALDISSMTGKIQMELAAGQFLKVDPGAAKLLGVLSMQSLPRRLTLDFRDVFSDGFAFDSIAGTAQIHQGIAMTENLKMRGVNATVLLDGSADVVRESQNLHVAVIPEVNAGTASVVYGLAVNPVIGLGTFLAQLFLREPLARAFTFEYQVTGPWKDPIVNKIEHRELQNNAIKSAQKKGNE
ncbi:YhdP family protein [Undibacterium sp. SXout7W]|uniref:YhdP family protein n=1 Tax=Undibacterium sp. SXout7W TaxID=3413049 RepID=UPI003BF07618